MSRLILFLALLSGSAHAALPTMKANITGNAATATALLANPAACSAGQFVNDIAANGTLSCAAPTGGITALTSDVSASGTGSVAATVNSVGGSSAANVHAAELLANAATPLNTASAIVKRGSSGEFSAAYLTLQNAQTAGTPGTETKITTGDPTTKGLVIKATSYTGAPISQTPGQVSGIQAWLKADALSLSNSDPVATWTSSDSNAYAFTSSGALRPTYVTNVQNGLPVVRFSGANVVSRATTTLLNGATDFTVIAVIKPSASQLSLANLFNYDMSSASGRIAFEQNGASTNTSYFTYRDGSGSFQAVANTQTLSTSWQILVWKKSGSVLYKYVNGAAGTHSTGLSTTVAQAAGTFHLGATDTTQRYWSGDIGEFAFFNRSVTEAEQKGIEQQLGSKWGISVSGGSITQPQSANLLEIQDNGGTRIAGFDGSGYLTAANLKLAYPTADVTTVSDVAANVTGMAVTVPASERWAFEAYIQNGCNGTGGIKFAFTAPSGATIRANAFGMNTGSTTFRADLMSALSSLTGAFNAFSGTGGFTRIIGSVTNSVNAGDLQLQFASTTSGQTSTVYKESWMRAWKL